MNTFNKRKIVLGLTGGIASGKSAAAEMLRSAGAQIVDTDEISKAISAKDEVTSLLSENFPSAAVGGKIDRRKLRGIVFSSAEERKKLEHIMHPLIRRETERQIGASGKNITVLVAPLLFEAGFDDLADVTVTVSCGDDERIRRLTARDNISEELAREMIAAQMTDSERETRADHTVRNDGSTARLRAEILRLYSELDFQAGG